MLSLQKEYVVETVNIIKSAKWRHVIANILQWMIFVVLFLGFFWANYLSLW